MNTNKATGQEFCSTRKELAEKYFNTFGNGVESVYANGNMGIVTLLSDAQHVIGDQHYIEILNDIKCILIAEDREREEANKPTIKKVNESNAVGTSCRGYFRFGTSYQTLVKKLGKPNRIGSSDGKVQAEWIFKFKPSPKDKALVMTVYDYKSDQLANETLDWHIGGKAEAEKYVPLLASFLDIPLEKK